MKRMLNLPPRTVQDYARKHISSDSCMRLYDYNKDVLSKISNGSPLELAVIRKLAISKNNDPIHKWADNVIKSMMR